MITAPLLLSKTYSLSRSMGYISFAIYILHWPSKFHSSHLLSFPSSLSFFPLPSLSTVQLSVNAAEAATPAKNQNHHLVLWLDLHCLSLWLLPTSPYKLYSILYTLTCATRKQLNTDATVPSSERQKPQKFSFPQSPCIHRCLPHYIASTADSVINILLYSIATFNISTPKPKQKQTHICERLTLPRPHSATFTHRYPFHRLGHMISPAHT